MKLFGYEIVKINARETGDPDGLVSLKTAVSALAALAEDVAVLRTGLNRVERKVYRNGKAPAGDEAEVSPGNPLQDFASVVRNLRSGDTPPPGMFVGGV